MNVKNNFGLIRKDIGYRGLHNRIESKLPKPELCEICNQPKKLELSNISGKYLDDLKDWQWICQKCHSIYDNIPSKISKSHKGKQHTETTKKKISKSIEKWWEERRRQ